MESVPSETFKAALVLKQPEISHLVRELRQLMQLTQVQLAAALGVAYETALHNIGMNFGFLLCIVHTASLLVLEKMVSAEVNRITFVFLVVANL